MICGYLSIEGLTAEFPTLMTYFEGEIIGEDYSFLTNKWDAETYTDFQHWQKFPAFKQFESNFNNSQSFSFVNSDYIFMRWKVIFLIS